MSEARLQQECFRWFWNTYPMYRGLLCYNNNNSTGGYRGRVNKFLGIVKGRSDLVFYFSSDAYMIELKVDGNPQRKEQKEWQALVERQGFTYFLIEDNLQDFKDLITKIIEREEIRFNHIPRIHKPFNEMDY